PYATADGTATVADNDYTAASGTLTFAPGQTQQTVTVLVNGDATPEPNETLSVNLSSPTCAVLGASQGTGTIVDLTPDKFDPNNAMTSAAKFGKVTSISQTGLTLDTPTNLDYFCFVAGSKGTFAVSAAPTMGSGTLGLAVYNASGTLLASNQPSSGTVAVSVSLSSGQTYYIKLWSPTSSLLAYNLSMSSSGGGGGGHHLVLPGVASPDVAEGPDVFYLNAADDPDNPGYVPHRSVSTSSVP